MRSYHVKVGKGLGSSYQTAVSHPRPKAPNTGGSPTSRWRPIPRHRVSRLSAWIHPWSHGLLAGPAKSALILTSKFVTNLHLIAAYAP